MSRPPVSSREPRARSRASFRWIAAALVIVVGLVAASAAVLVRRQASHLARMDGLIARVEGDPPRPAPAGFPQVETIGTHLLWGDDADRVRDLEEQMAELDDLAELDLDTLAEPLAPGGPDWLPLDLRLEQHARREAIRTAIRAHLGEIRACYEHGLWWEPDMEGRVTARLVLGPEGTVQSIGLSSELHSPSVETCIDYVLRSVDFPAQQSGVSVVSYPFVFSAR